MNDENDDSFSDLLSNEDDSGYLTFIFSPSRLSPSVVVLNPLSQTFASPTDYENYISTRKYFDILTQLYHRNAYHLIEEILKHLSNRDLFDCLNVCKKWNFILKDSYRRKQTKECQTKFI